ncbi:phosphoribosylformylglycinamidine synthase subunit PurL [Candidatus Margulisiibacteriota bacterium]
MNLKEEDLIKIKEIIGREPTLVEKYIFDTMWSEHCSYKSSKDVLKKYLPTKGSEVALGIGEDAGIVHFTEHNGKKYCVAVAHESHNHPSQILPIEGAATGVGGVVRDVYCMGADVVGVLNSLHFGLDTEKNNPIVDEIAEEVVIGVSDYANPLGVPVLGGETIFHTSYNDNCLVNVAAIGIMDEKHLIHSFVPSEAKDEPYDVLLVGKSTDATGFGGASFSSVILDSEDQDKNVGAVQVHDPFLKRVIVEATKFLMKEVNEQGIKIGFKDLGAGGISCATSEIAAANGFGVTVDLNKVNLAFDDLLPEVIACSETQERYCLVVPKTFSARVLEIYNDMFELPELYHKAGAAIIGEVIREQVFRLIYEGKNVCELPVQAITTEVKVKREGLPREIDRTVEGKPEIADSRIEDLGKQILKLENNTSNRNVYRFFDNAVRGDTIVYPGEADAVVIAPVKDCKTGLVVSIDSNLYGGVDPYVSGASAVAEAIRNLICMGARPITITDCLNYGNPEKPAVFFDFEQGVKGIADACHSFSFIDNEPIPIVSGNVSFYNESNQGNAIVPSPVIVAVGKMEDYQKTITMQVKEIDEEIILLGERHPEFGGTQIKNTINDLNNVAPQVRFEQESKINKIVHQLILDKLLSACHDISAGGLWVCLVEMLLGERGNFKVGLDLNFNEKEDLFTMLFSENGGFVISVANNHSFQVKNLLQAANVPFTVLGKTTAGSDITIRKTDKVTAGFDLNRLASIWNRKNI